MTGYTGTVNLTICECCERPGAKRERQRTAYEDDECNWVTLCPPCAEANDAYWRERWDEFYGGLL